jgi:hypothetical protein
VTLISLGWDQTDTSVKIYVNLDGVEKHQEKISVNFGNKCGSIIVAVAIGYSYTCM